MKTKCFMIYIILFLLFISGMAMASLNSIEVYADTSKSSNAGYKNLLNADSGVGNIENINNDIDNYTPNSSHSYDNRLNSEVFYINLTANFESGGEITISPDYSNNPGSDVPVIIGNAYVYNSDSKETVPLYTDNTTSTPSNNGFSMIKSGNDYKISIPRNDKISNYTIVFTILPLTSGNSVELHPSYGADLTAQNNDGNVDGSAYSNEHGWGILWGQMKNSSTPEMTSSATVTQGDQIPLSSFVKDYKATENQQFVIRDSEGNLLKTTSKSVDNWTNLPVGKYYLTYYTQDQNNDNIWNTTIITIKNPTPLPDTNTNTDTGKQNTTPTEPTPTKGTVITRYVDQNGTRIAPDHTQDGITGEPYKTTQESISGYTLSEIPGNATGTYTDGTVLVTYVYSKNASIAPNINNSQVPVKGEAVYAIKKIGLYKSPNFSKKNRIKWYGIAKRINRAEFIIRGYKRDKFGHLKYRVQQYNPYTQKYVNGTRGYISSSSKDVIPAYYALVPKRQKITIINKRGINSYKNQSLTKKVSHHKRGETLLVKKIIQYKLSTRFILANGSYITANKKFILTEK
ncbi:MAG: DUF5776 domain-containing protein [Lentilactobacillus hilgardii]|uniref:DUF5776 domain-containing protein n=2 Tax=Lentilactobacillus hilgardii TaxID=1588 RepID=UPI001CC1FF3E|nr:DUF5776 domain-containing protein [Lentilactobacillus hilgardii]MBZ2200283.1 hypothetical protein [Lentilactobacillus hilgardii]MBZ2203408.1 hypothetical protein [Lentilactobacillus hilgardii]